jgi:hypothetical protein
MLHRAFRDSPRSAGLWQSYQDFMWLRWSSGRFQGSLTALLNGPHRADLAVVLLAAADHREKRSYPLEAVRLWLQGAGPAPGSNAAAANIASTGLAIGKRDGYTGPALTARGGALWPAKAETSSTFHAEPTERII